MQTLAPGASLAQDGSDADSMTVIVSGSCDVVKDPDALGEEDKESYILRTLGPGDYFGHMSILSTKAWGASVVATTNIICFTIKKEDLIEVAGRDFVPDMRSQIPAWVLKRSELNPNQVGVVAVDAPLETAAESGSSTSASLPAAAKTKSGELTLGCLDVVRELGKGSYGVVLMVKDTFTGTLFALKSMKKSVIKEQELELAVLGEKEALCDLRHRNIIKLIKTFASGGSLHMLMEVARGGELLERIRENAAQSRGSRRHVGLPMSHAKYYAASAISALRYIRRKRYIHRDLKPENAMIDEHGILKIVDFGFARQIIKGRAFTICGTQLYISPEMLLGSGYSFSADWWSFGVFLFEMLHGYNPFEDASSTEELIRRILASQFKMPIRKGGAEGSQANDIVNNLLRVDTTARMEFVDGKLQTHAWFSSIDWTKLSMAETKPPWQPNLSSEIDVYNFIDPEPAKEMPSPSWRVRRSGTVDDDKQEWFAEWEAISASEATSGQECPSKRSRSAKKKRKKNRMK